MKIYVIKKRAGKTPGFFPYVPVECCEGNLRVGVFFLRRLDAEAYLLTKIKKKERYEIVEIDTEKIK